MASLVTVLLFFVFTTLGMSMLFLSQVYLKLSSYKKNTIILDYSSENGIKRGFDHLVTLASMPASPVVISEERTLALLEDARRKGLRAVEECLGVDFPIILQETWQEMSWECQTSCFVENLKESDTYFRVKYKIFLDSEGSFARFAPKKKSRLESSVEIVGGCIPLTYFPLLIDKNLEEGEKNEFLVNQGINIFPSDNNSIAQKASFSDGNLLPDDANSLLYKALKVKLFFPQNLTTLQLRSVLGLELTNEPVPEGVYLIQDDLGLGGVYVEGDAEEIIFAIEGDYQVVSFRMGEKIWLLKFNPSEGETIFATPETTSSYRFTPLGIIIVSGNILSLGGGIIGPTGQATLVLEEEIPSLLRGVRLTIVSSGEMTLSSHLIQQGLRWENGLPYLEESQSQLILFSTGSDLWQNTEREGGIFIHEASPKEMKIQASLTASGKGFLIKGEGKSIHLLGALQASDYLSKGNSLKIFPTDRDSDNSSLFDNSPHTKEPVLRVSSFKPLNWQEYY